MSSELKKRNIPFSPPDMSEEEARMATEAILSGWITTGPKTKEFERRIAEYCGTDKAVCLNSATACMEMILRVLGVISEAETAEGTPAPASRKMAFLTFSASTPRLFR